MKLLTDEFLELLLEQPSDSLPTRGKRTTPTSDTAADDKSTESKTRTKGGGDGDREAA
jgi:hypothetical protein